MKYIPKAISTKIARQALLAQKHSPTILFGVGVVGVVGTTVLASKATLKLEEVLKESKSNLEIAKTLEHPDYSEEDRNKDIIIIYVQSTQALLKLYGPALLVGTLSIAALTQSHNILSRRNAALGAAYAALEKGFKEYRARVVDELGAEKDRDFRYGVEKLEYVDEKTGKSKVAQVVSADAPSIYARFFDEFSPSWSPYPEYNSLFLRCQQNWANDMLHARGHVFLNEVYDQLGIPRSEAGALVGWVLGHGDDFIDFGIFNGDESARHFVNNREASILLDFNVDGLIYNLIEKNRK